LNPITISKREDANKRNNQIKLLSSSQIKVENKTPELLSPTLTIDKKQFFNENPTFKYKLRNSVPSKLVLA
jgi:hypothetical protein